MSRQPPPPIFTPEHTDIFKANVPEGYQFVMLAFNGLEMHSVVHATEAHLVQAATSFFIRTVQQSHANGAPDLLSQSAFNEVMALHVAMRQAMREERGGAGDAPE